MRTLAWIVVAGCASSPAPAIMQTPAPPVPTMIETRSCTDAAIGIERATKSLRKPDQDLLGPMRRRCTQDAWSTVAIDCFASMAEADLAACARHLPEDQREHLLAEITGAQQDDAAEIADIVVRLQALKVGIQTCDRFVEAVTVVMSCRAMESAVRVQLGNETADFWSLPTAKLSFQDRARMAAACGESLQALQQQSVDLGCMP